MALVVDPQRDITQYVEEAKKYKLRIVNVFLTHFHADFVAGHLELHQQTEAQICLGAQAQAGYPFQAFPDGKSLTYGDLRVQVLETPGHTPESISLLVFDLHQSSDRPYAILTGDALLNGDVGRPDLLEFQGYNSRTLAENLYDSLHEKILPLPDDTLVYPTHGPGTFCAKIRHHELFSTLGVQKHTNPALQPMEKESFCDRLTTNQPDPPSYFRYDAAVNARNRSCLDKVINNALNPLPLDQVLRWKTSRANLLDIRDAEEFAKEHMLDCLNIGLNGKFEFWVGTLLHPESPIVLIAEPGQARQAVLRLARIGFDHVVGYLKGGALALAATPELIHSVQHMTVEDLDAHLLSENPPYIVDVRSKEEWEERRIDHSHNIPLNHLQDRLQEIPTDREVVVHCSDGYRSSIAVSLLHRHDVCHVRHVLGGFEAWEHMVMNSSGTLADVSRQIGGR